MEKTLDYAVMAAGNGYATCLSYALASGCPRHEDICVAAAQNGQVRCLEIAHENGCPLSAEVCAKATAGGSIDCLIFARLHGAPWDEYTMFNGYYYDQWECLEYAEENECPCMTIEDILKTFLNRVLMDPNDSTYYRVNMIMHLIRCALSMQWDGFGSHSGFSDEQKQVLVKVFQYYTYAKRIANAYRRFKMRSSKDKLDVFRKELIEKACHPRRYFTSCLDIDEQRELGLCVCVPPLGDLRSPNPIGVIGAFCPYAAHHGNKTVSF